MFFNRRKSKPWVHKMPSQDRSDRSPKGLLRSHRLGTQKVSKESAPGPTGPVGSVGSVGSVAPSAASPGVGEKCQAKSRVKFHSGLG